MKCNEEKSICTSITTGCTQSSRVSAWTQYTKKSTKVAAQ